MIDGLNQDLAGEYQAILMYINYSAKLTGPYRRELRALFQAEVPDEQGHAQFLSDKICRHGRRTDHGTKARAARRPAARDAGTGPQGRKHRRSRTTPSASARPRSFGEIGLKVSLENQLADETRHKEEIERILKGWSGRNLNEVPMQDVGGQG